MALLEQRGKLKDEGDKLLATARDAGRVLTEDEEARFAEIESGMNRINADVAREQKWRESQRNAPALDIEDPEPETAQLPSNPVPSAKTYKGPRLFANIAEQLQAIQAAATGRGVDPRLMELQAAAQGAGEAVPADGGYLVQQDFANEIMRLMHDRGQLLSRVRRIPVSGNGLKLNAIDESSRVDGSRGGAVRGYWVDEGSAPTASRPKFKRVNLELKKVAALGYASDELLSDAGAMSAIFTDEFANELVFKVEDAIYEGDGAGKPTGFANSNVNPAFISVAKETGQTAATIVSNNIIKMRARLWAPSRGNSVWFINQDTEPQLSLMTITVGTGGVPVYMPASGLSEDGYDRLYGRPVVPIEFAATLGTVGDIVLADLSQYALIDKGGVRQDTSMHVAFTTAEQAFRAQYRVDGQSLWSSALTPFKGSNTVSPFIGLATRA
ncbi:MAG: phage major capsid protein [Chloroflexi bacterium]|nr:phage major capsid protein [Chloroflexota bacterium]